MPRPSDTRARIVKAAASLFYREGIGRVSVDAVAKKAGVTKRTLYYHFDSKDALAAAYLEARDQPAIDEMAQWFEAAEGDLADKTTAVFVNLAQGARRPGWRGCGFLRTAAELAALPGHPAVQAGARHKARFEAWLAERFAAGGAAEPEALAREVLLLLDGAFSLALVRRDPDCFLAAGEAAAALIRRRLSPPPP